MALVGKEDLELSRARATVYSWLSRLFRREADRELLEGLIEADFVRAWGVLGSSGQEESRVLCDLAGDYAYTFLMGEGSVHPYESAYTSDKGLLMQDAFRDARRCYAEAGFSVSDASGEMDDHIALELEFMARLAERLSAALHQGDEGSARSLLECQRAFHRVHLHWVVRFADDVEARARTAFYRKAARLLADVVSSDIAFMDDLDSALSSSALSRASAVA